MIRPAKASDIDKIKELLLNDFEGSFLCGYVHLAEMKIDMDLWTPIFVYEVEEDKETKIVGWVGLDFNTRLSTCNISDIFIRKAYRFKSFASELLQFSEKYAKRLNMTTIRTVIFEYNKASILLFEKKGYTDYGYSLDANIALDGKFYKNVFYGKKLW